jgi:hypothetical protein
MILHGHEFLRSDFADNAPVRSTANALNARRIPDVLKTIQGIGCSVEKPVDCEGRNWNINLYHSDIAPPPGVDDPWTAHIVDQFRVHRAPANEKYFVRGGIYAGKSPLYDATSALPYVAWYPEDDDVDAPDGDPGDISLPVYIDADTSQRVWMIDTGSYLILVYYDAAMTSAEVSDAVTAGGETVDSLLCVALVERPATGAIVVTQLMDNFEVYAPITFDSFTVRGGVWQYRDGTETKVIAPEGGGITWGDDGADNDSAWSNPCDASADAASVLWAKLDLSSTVPALTLHLLAAAPTWAADVYWRKLASVTRKGDPAEDPTQVTIEIKQHHSGSPEGALEVAYGTSTLSGASDSTLNPAAVEKLDFSTAANSNTDTLEADATDDDITIKKAGWYTVTIAGLIHLDIDPVSSAPWVAAYAYKGESAIGEDIRLTTDDIGVSTGASGDGDITVRLCTSFDVELAADDVLTMRVTGAATGADIDQARLNVRYLHP